jgi:hypothetical protein
MAKDRRANGVRPCRRQKRAFAPTEALHKYTAEPLVCPDAVDEPDHDSCNLLMVVGTMIGALGQVGRPSDLSPQVDSAPADGDQ